MPIYGQVVVGPPGSGKTTYCQGMQEYLRLLGRNAWVVNLDPANEAIPGGGGGGRGNRNGNGNDSDHDDDEENDNRNTSLPYDALVDVCESVVNLSSVMQQLGLGPNGGLVYCMEYLEAHTDQVVDTIAQQVRTETNNNTNKNKNVYLLFDLPGQVELYTHGTAVPTMLHKLTKALDLRLVNVQLMDAHYCTEPANFLSAALLATNIMLRLELPAVSVLSKIDLLANYGPLPFSLDYFTDCQDLDRLVPYLLQQHDDTADDDDDDIQNDFDDDDNNNNNYADDPDFQIARKRTRSSPFFRKHQRLHQVMAETVEDFGLVSFLPLDISSAESVGRVLAKIDKCNGYIFVANKSTNSANAGGNGTNDNKSNKNGLTATTEDLFQCAIQSEPSKYEITADIQERLTLARQHNRNERQQQRNKGPTAKPLL